MGSNKTFTIIKPDAVSSGKMGLIINDILEAGFNFKEMKLIKLNQKQAQNFYSVHKDKSFFNELVNFITSGPIVVAILEKENAVLEYRELIGATNPIEAKDGTIRKKYAESIRKNAVHGSDSDENSEIECNFFF